MTRCIGIRIAGYGDPTAGAAGDTSDLAKCYVLGNFAPAFDTDGLWVAGHAVGLPAEMQWGIDPTACTTEVGEVAFPIIPRTSGARGLLLRTRSRRVAQALSALTSVGTSLTLDTTGLVGTTIMWGREAIYLQSAVGAVYTVIRGVLGTVATAHSNGDGDDIEVFNAAHGRYIQGRRCEIVEVDSGAAGYSSIAVRYAGLIDDIEDHAGVVSITVHSLLQSIKNNRVGRGLWRGTLQSGISGSRHWVYLGAGEPLAGYSGDPRALFALGSSAAVLSYTYNSNTNTTSVVIDRDGIAPWGDSAPTPTDPPADIREMVSSDPSAPASSATPGDTTLPLSTSALTQVLQMLTTNNTPGTNGNYNLGMGALGLAVPVDRVDVEAIEALRESIDDYMPSVHWCADLKSMDVGALLVRLLRPLGCVLTLNTSGQLTIRRIGATYDVGPMPAIGDSDLVVTPEGEAILPTWRRHGTPILRDVETEYHDRVGVDPRTVEAQLQESTRLARTYGLEGFLEAQGIRGQLRAITVTNALLGRHSTELPIIDTTVDGSVNYAPGDMVEATFAHVAGGDGEYGITDGLCMVLDRQDEGATGHIKYGLLYIGVRYDRIGLYAPALEVTAYAAPTITVARTAEAGNGAWPNANSEFAVPLANAGLTQVEVLLCDSTLQRIGAGVVSISGTGQLTVVSGLTSPAPNAGDYLVFQRYGILNSALRGRWASLAGSDGKVGSGGDTGYEWTD